MATTLAGNAALTASPGAPIALGGRKKRSLGGPAAPSSTPPVFAKGFRLFFLLAGAQAVLLLPAWLLTLAGVLQPVRYFDAMTWHAHEMLFGFTTAVIAGFLLTAVANWTGRETLVGRPLLIAGALWAAGRLAMTIPGALPRFVPAVVDLAFLPVLAVAIARPLVAANNRKNFVMLGVLSVLWATNLAVHLDALGVASGLRSRAVGLALDLVVLLMILIAGRVFPMFTKNGTGDADVAGHPTLDKLAAVAMVVTCVLDLSLADARAGAVAAGVAGVLVAARAHGWMTRKIARVPLVWILHVGHAWIVLGLLLRPLSAFTSLASSAQATHALTVGGIGCLTLGMMTRVSLGHTGRLLAASPGMVGSFVLLTLAALVRVVAPFFTVAGYRTSVFVAGGLFTAAFVVFVAVVGPLLIAPRADGKAG